MQIRRATAADVPAVVRLVESAYRGPDSSLGWTTEADLLDGQRTDTDEVQDLLPHVLLLELAGELVGCCVLQDRGECGYIGMFAVRPERQAGGLGSALLAAAEERAASAGLTCLEMTVLSVRAELLAFYARRGYLVTGETRPFPYGDQRFGMPRRDDLVFAVLRKRL